MADDIAPAIVQAASMMNRSRIVSIRAKGVGFPILDDHFESDILDWDCSVAFRIVGLGDRTPGFYFMEDAVNFLLKEGYQLLAPDDLSSWILTLNRGKRVSDMVVVPRGLNPYDGDSNICVAVFEKDLMNHFSANLQANSNSPTDTLTASILSASARYLTKHEPRSIATIVRLTGHPFYDGIVKFEIRGLDAQQKRFLSLEDTYNYLLESGYVPFAKEQQELWKHVITTGMHLVGEEVNRGSCHYTLPEDRVEYVFAANK